MASAAPITTDDGWFKGEDKTFRFFVDTGQEIQMDATFSSGVTSLIVKRLPFALNSGDKLRFGELVVTLSAPAVIGATTIAVDATTGILYRNARGVVVQNVTGWTLEWSMRTSAAATGAATLTSGVAGVTISAPTPTEGVVEVFVSDQDSINLDARTYYHTLRRTNAGFEAILATGPAVLQESAARD